ncbi:Phosphoglycerate mutase [Methylobacterium sp. 4-46]|uniref:histidine phosphatase family protein n=1 Tax=unclassified Methylobacterium TaxID=2615210 RepID=UPI000165C832|nr:MULTISPECIES: histidine phosphatase family protein [Methylobacterium]ACA16577.1 Phosphoglycerate mutase [Methylobacterium sp. 4-46]WFT82284.1 histidine phosphatase family protein [Methylobacterium nodulans]
MTTTFFLVRHAAHGHLDRTLCGRMPGIRLGEEGRAQARALALRLTPERLDAVYASPLERAQETAAPIAAAAGLGVDTLPGLNEIDFGEWSGRSFEDLHGDPRWTYWNTARHVTRPPGGETVLEAQARAVGTLEALRARHGEARLALVSHADVIKLVLAYALGLAPDAMGRFEVSPASVSAVILGEWGAKVERINERVAA